MKKFNKKIALIVSLVLILAVTVAGTLAFIADKTPGLVNTFEPGEISGDIVEDISDGIKKNVKVENTGDAAAYVRVNVITTWQNENGDVYSENPVVGEDYDITFHTYPGDSDSNWIKGSDGYYYYRFPLEKGKVTEGSLLTCESTTMRGEYFIAVNIIVQCIQADTDAVIDAWGVTMKDASTGEITK